MPRIRFDALPEECALLLVMYSSAILCSYLVTMTARCAAGLLPWVLTETLIGEDHIHEVTPRFGSSAGARSSLCDMSLIVAAAEPFRSRAANFTQNLVLLKHGTSLSREDV